MKKAFTLIELLVVITIVAILSAILFPVFSQAKASAKNIQDLSNIRQLGTTSFLYSSDSDDVYVPVGSFNDPTITPYNNPTGANWNGWALKLSQYAKNKDIFVSPFMPKTATWWTGPCATSNGMKITSTYSYNWFLGADQSYPEYPGEYYTTTPNGSKFLTPLNGNSIESTTSTLLFQLSQTTSSYGNDFGCAYNTLESPDWDNKIRFRAVHRQGGNLTFTDGHAKFYLAKEADSALDNGAPKYTIYIWKSRNIWSYPFMPSNNGGFSEEPF